MEPWKPEPASAKPDPENLEPGAKIRCADFCPPTKMSLTSKRELLNSMMRETGPKNSEHAAPEPAVLKMRSLGPWKLEQAAPELSKMKSLGPWKLELHGAPELSCGGGAAAHAASWAPGLRAATPQVTATNSESTASETRTAQNQKILAP